jgi:putative ABC transport system permease protein
MGFLVHKMHQANPTITTIHLKGGGFKPLRLIKLVSFMRKLFPKFDRSLAWANLSHQKVRLAVAMGGIAFANILIFMQLGFVNLFAGGALLLPQHLDGDLFLMNPDATFIGANNFDLTLLHQAAAFDGIVSAEPLYINIGTWALNRDKISYATRVLAYNPIVPAFDLTELDRQRDRLSSPSHVLFDRLSRSELGPVPTQIGEGKNVSAFFNQKKIIVAGLFSLGTSFFSGEGNIVMSQLNYGELFGHSALQQVAVGIIHIKPGTNSIALQRGIKKYVPGLDVLTKQELKVKELNFQSENPAGTIFNFGAMMGFIVGVAIVYQVLYSDVSDRLSEYATLKAIGYSNRSLLTVIFHQAGLLAMLGFVPGVIASVGMYRVLTALTKLELVMDLSLAVTVFGLTLAMCSISAAIAANKLRSADPADVF